MNAKTMQELLKRQPFRPFEVRMSNGDNHEIRHPEMAFLAGNSLIVYHAETDHISILSLLHASVIETQMAS